jgi:hypothetical protein
MPRLARRAKWQKVARCATFGETEHKSEHSCCLAYPYEAYSVNFSPGRCVLANLCLGAKPFRRPGSTTTQRDLGLKPAKTTTLAVSGVLILVLAGVFRLIHGEFVASGEFDCRGARRGAGGAQARR